MAARTRTAVPLASCSIDSAGMPRAGSGGVQLHSAGMPRSGSGGHNGLNGGVMLAAVVGCRSVSLSV